jgi:REP element-mobilizing transposase RayT
MQYDPDHHHRRSIRLQSYDYTQAGAYFLTISVQNNAAHFGTIRDEAMELNSAGEMIADWWLRLPSKFPSLSLDTFVVMPNHFHGIITLQGATTIAAEESGSKPAVSLGQVVQWFKTMTTNAYIRAVHTQGWAPFERRLWQRNYYEHIIRDDADLARIRAYIANNPQQWQADA